jgi:hypothetical protein
MGILRRKQSGGSVAGLSAAENAELQRNLHKDLRGASELIGPNLDTDEVLINFFKTPARGTSPPAYTFLTSTHVWIAIFEDLGEVISYRHEDLAGLRIEAGYVRLAYVVDGDLRIPTFFAAGGPTDCVAFYGQFAEAWSKRCGREFPKDKFKDATIVPKFEWAT